MDVTNFVQTKAKAISAFVTTTAAPLLALYTVNQNVTLKQLVGAVVAGVLGGAATHQIANKK